MQFTVTDRFHDMPVVYNGILPDLFREGQSVIVTGHMDGHHFVGTEVLAKHDETYMPKEVADAIRKAKAAERADAAATWPRPPREVTDDAPRTRTIGPDPGPAAGHGAGRAAA